MTHIARTARPTSRRIATAAGLALAVALSTIAGQPAVAQDVPAAPPPLIPAPVSMQTTGEVFTLGPNSKITVDPGAPAAALTEATKLAEFLRPATGFSLKVARQGWGAQQHQTGPGNRPRNIHLSLTGDRDALGPEGYTLDALGHAVRIAAATGEGLFRGAQTLRQLLPSQIESDVVQAGPWTVPGVRIVDHPRYEWRGAHLDVSRHFLSVAEVKRYLDLLALYKVNRFHMHLSDDQGWRIQIDSWPNLTLIGGSSQVGGGVGGYYTKAEYTEIVRHAARYHIVVVPEIDVPGHTNAIEVSYPELNSCRPGNLPSHKVRLGAPWANQPHYTGTAVGFSSLCVHDEITYEFMADVIREISELTPGPYFHVGGDEAAQTPVGDYVMFMDRVRDMVAANGKVMMGWAEIARANAHPGAIAQNWSTATGNGSGGNLARTAAAKDMKVVMSPANRVYLDMKYAPGIPANLGLTWAGTAEVMQSYNWNPATHLTGVTDDNVIGVEAPLWSETIVRISDAEYMAYPRMAGVAEIGWTPQSGRDWNEYRLRLAAQADRWEKLNVNFYRSPQVPWPSARPNSFSSEYDHAVANHG